MNVEGTPSGTPARAILEPRACCLKMRIKEHIHLLAVAAPVDLQYLRRRLRVTCERYEVMQRDHRT